MLPFPATDDFCREVSRLYGDKEAFYLQSSLLEPGRVEIGLYLFHVSFSLWPSEPDYTSLLKNVDKNL